MILQFIKQHFVVAFFLIGLGYVIGFISCTLWVAFSSWYMAREDLKNEKRDRHIV